MYPARRLEETLSRIDGRGYKAYQDIRGVYSIAGYEVEIAHVQGDPYAPPSRVHVRVDLAALGYGPKWVEEPARRLAFSDYLGRSLAEALRRRGTRDIRIDFYGQQVLRRTSLFVDGNRLEARLFVHLPAAGRRILGRRAAAILLRELPDILAASLPLRAVNTDALTKHQDVVEDYFALSRALRERGLVAFVGNGAVLPRRAGHDDRPLMDDGSVKVVRFQSAGPLEVQIRVPNAGVLTGMGIPEGVTLLVGGGFHGKSTLLDAIALGIYPHIPGDGRERVAADPATLKVRAEDGRAVSSADISPFIDDLPFGRSTRDFSTQNASGSTSQAAGIIEALEAGAKVLLLDEDTSATNFMIRDEPMRRLLRPGQEPITPFLDRVRNLYRDRGVSSLLVVGGSGEYFKVADRVIQMDHYLPQDVTERAREIVGLEAPREGERFPEPAGPRRFSLRSYGRRVGPKGPKVKAVGQLRLVAEREEVDLTACEQIVSDSQARLLAEILARLIDPGRGGPWASLGHSFTATELTDLMGRLGEGLLDAACRFPRGDLAMVRPLEVLALLNRLRDIEVRLKRDGTR